MKHVDLFSGIGGFALAVDRVWPGSRHTFCEIDPFCQEVLKKHWPHEKIYSDIRTLTADAECDRLQKSWPEQQAAGHRQPNENTRAFILTGGFPCQPFSQAGLRGGTSDDRFLWPEMLRVIQEFEPTWVIAENVRGILTIEHGMVFEQVCTDLEDAGYEVQPLIIPAVAVNAPHRRDRVWFVAKYTKCGNGTRKPTSERPGKVSQSTNKGSWNQNWLEVATRLCRVDDGLPRRMDRNPRLKALGNAIVPQVAEEIFKAIKSNLLRQSMPE